MLDTKEMRQLNMAVTPTTQTAICPTCATHSEFTFHGTQTWPPKVAQAMNLPEVINVWHCQSCDTTLLEPNLDFDKPTQ